MARRARLDAELVRRGLARSRQHAADLIAAGHVRIGGMVAAKPATAVAADAPLSVAGPAEGPTYVSRGADKLAGALAAWAGPPVAGRRCLDAGASTGGFTDVLLRHGAVQVVAVDVGYGQLAWRLRQDPRVVVLERTNVRDLTPHQVGEPPPDLVVADLSFISLCLVLPALRRVARPDGDLVVLVKPQFEAGRDQVGAGGVVTDPAVRLAALQRVAGCAQREGLGLRAAVASSLPGPAGNVEYFLWLRAGAEPATHDRLARAVEEGPR